MKTHNLLSKAAGVALLSAMALLIVGGGCESDKHATPTVPGGSAYVLEFLDEAPVVAAGDSATLCVRVQTGGANPRPVPGVTVSVW